MILKVLAGEIRAGTFEAPGMRVAGFTVPDGPMTLGFRAEDARIAAAGEMKAPVYSMELLGDASMVTLQIAPGSYAAIKTPKDFVARIGDVLCADLPASICHLFDPVTGIRIAGAGL